jgi:hypothetical protein
VAALLFMLAYSLCSSFCLFVLIIKALLYDYGHDTNRISRVTQQSFGFSCIFYIERVDKSQTRKGGFEK